MKSLPDDLRSTDVEVVYDAIIDAGKQGRRELRDAVESYLGHADAGLREAALKTLGFYWALPEYEEVAVRAIRDDEDLGVRSAAAMALSGYAGREALAVLLEVALDQREDESVRDMAYASALVRAGISKQDYPMRSMFPGFEQRADWKLLARLVATTEVPVPARLRELAGEGEVV